MESALMEAGSARGPDRIADGAEEAVLGAVEVDDRSDLGHLARGEGSLGLEDLELDAVALLEAELREAQGLGRRGDALLRGGDLLLGCDGELVGRDDLALDLDAEPFVLDPRLAHAGRRRVDRWDVEEPAGTDAPSDGDGHVVRGTRPIEDGAELSRRETARRARDEATPFGSLVLALGGGDEGLGLPELGARRERLGEELIERDLVRDVHDLRDEGLDRGLLGHEHLDRHDLDGRLELEDGGEARRGQLHVRLGARELELLLRHLGRGPEDIRLDAGTEPELRLLVVLEALRFTEGVARDACHRVGPDELVVGLGHLQGALRARGVGRRLGRVGAPRCGESAEDDVSRLPVAERAEPPELGLLGHVLERSVRLLEEVAVVVERDPGRDPREETRPRRVDPLAGLDGLLRREANVDAPRARNGEGVREVDLEDAASTGGRADDTDAGELRRVLERWEVVDSERRWVLARAAGGNENEGREQREAPHSLFAPPRSADLRSTATTAVPSVSRLPRTTAWVASMPFRISTIAPVSIPVVTVLRRALPFSTTKTTRAPSCSRIVSAGSVSASS